MIPVRYAASYGAIAAFLLGLIITLILDAHVGDILYRLLILCACGALMAAVLAWMSQLLFAKTHKKNVVREEDNT